VQVVPMGDPSKPAQYHRARAALFVLFHESLGRLLTVFAPVWIPSASPNELPPTWGERQPPGCK